jgi:hypothetical protein
MTTLKISKTTTEEQVIEVNLPVYRTGSNNSLFYKVYSPDKCIQVWTYPGMEAITNAHAGLAYSGSPDTIECTEEVYKLALELASLRLSSL